MTPKRLNLIRFKSNDKLPSSAEPHVVVVARSHLVPHSIEKSDDRVPTTVESTHCTRHGLKRTAVKL